jgi:glycerophosphoryl diester phosphodiesterase
MTQRRLTIRLSHARHRVERPARGRTTGLVQPHFFPRLHGVKRHAACTVPARMICRILAHRGNTDGSNPQRENGVAAMQAALERGWGLSIDVRRAADGRFYVSRDARAIPAGPTAAVHAALVRRFPHAPVAVHVRERGDEPALVAFLAAEGLLPQSFLFGMETSDSRAGGVARRFRALNPHVRLAVRANDRGESIERALGVEVASVVWLEELDGPWIADADVRRLRAAGRQIYVVSSDVHDEADGPDRSGRSLDRARARWGEIVSYGVDGICTNYPAALEHVLAAVPQAVSA